MAFPYCNQKFLIRQAVYDAVKSLHPQGRYLKEKDGETGGIILWEEIVREGQSSHKRSGKWANV
jgi:hypothetical protein